MIPLTDFLPDVYALVRSVAEPIAITALRDVADEFCESTGYWVEELDPQPALKGVAEVDLEPPDQARVVLVQAARFAGREIRPRTHDELDRLYMGQDWAEVQGTPLYYTQFVDDALRLVPFPTETTSSAIRVRAVLSLSLDATQVPDEFRKFSRDFAHGAAARLAREPGREYYDPIAAERHAMAFKAAVSKARASANRSRTRGPLRVQMVRL